MGASTEKRAVFVTAHPADHDIARALADHLGRDGFEVADRDQPEAATGAASASTDAAMDRADAVVLLYSAAAEHDPWVRFRVETASMRHVPIVPVNVDGHPRCDWVRENLGARRWIDIADEPSQGWMPAVHEALTRLLAPEHDLEPTAPPVDTAPPPWDDDWGPNPDGPRAPRVAAPVPAPSVPVLPADIAAAQAALDPGERQPPPRSAIFAAVGVVLLLVIIVATVLTAGRGTGTAGNATLVPTTLASDLSDSLARADERAKSLRVTSETMGPRWTEVSDRVEADADATTCLSSVRSSSTLDVERQVFAKDWVPAQPPYATISAASLVVRDAAAADTMTAAIRSQPTIDCLAAQVEDLIAERLGTAVTVEMSGEALTLPSGEDTPLDDARGWRLTATYVDPSTDQTVSYFANVVAVADGDLMSVLTYAGPEPDLPVIERSVQAAAENQGLAT